MWTCQTLTHSPGKKSRWNKLKQQPPRHEWDGGEKEWRKRQRVVWDAEDSCSVTAAPFSQPVRTVFVTSDVSIKTQAAIGVHPLLSAALLPRPPCSNGINVAFHSSTLAQTLSVLLALTSSLQHSHTDTHRAVGLIVSAGQTPGIEIGKKKECSGGWRQCWTLKSL